MSPRVLVPAFVVLALVAGFWAYQQRSSQTEEELVEQPEERGDRELVAISDQESEAPAEPESMVKSGKANVQLQATYLGEDSYHWVILRTSINEPFARICPDARDGSEWVPRELEAAEYLAEFEVPPEQEFFLGLYSCYGDLLVSEKLERALEPGENYVWQPELDFTREFREYYFAFHPEAAQEFDPSASGKIAVELIEDSVAVALRRTQFDYAPEKVYRMLIPADRPRLVRFRWVLPGTATWWAEEGRGTSEAEPDYISLNWTVRVLIPNAIALEASRQAEPEDVHITDAMGMTDVRKLKPLDDGLHHEITGVSTSTKSIRIGRRLYQCAFPVGGDFLLNSEAVQEVALQQDGFAELSLDLSAISNPDAQIFYRVLVDGAIWTRNLGPRKLSATSRPVLLVPQGKVRIEVRESLLDPWMSSDLQVPAEGLVHRVGVAG